MASFPEALNTYDAATPANNTPAGADAVGTELDDHLRDIKANIRVSANLTPSATSSAAVTMAQTHLNQLILVDPAAGSTTVSVLTAAAALSGFRVGIKNVTGAGNVVVARSGTDTIDGAVAVTLSATHQAVMLACNGSTWYKTAEVTPNPARMVTGTFTGDGSGVASGGQSVTGIGFSVKYLKIWQRQTTDGGNIDTFEATNTVVDDNASGMAVHHIPAGGHMGADDAIISLDADGFTVGDQATDDHPNKASQTYNYIAMG